MDKVELTDKQKSIIFWSSFLALMAAGIGFGIRVMSIGIWEKEFAISGDEAGALFGASLWPIAIGMILFSLIVDKRGYKVSMMLAFVCLAGSSIWTLFAGNTTQVTWAFVFFGCLVARLCPILPLFRGSGSAVGPWFVQACFEALLVFRLL